MKKNMITRTVVMGILVVVGCIAANAEKAYAPYGQFSNETWSAKYFYSLIADGTSPASDWFAADFDDSAWESIAGPISLAEQWSSYPALSFIGTVWKENNSSYWVRRHFTVNDLNHDSFVFYVTHDDACTAYLNGVQIYNNSGALTYPNYNTVVLTGNAKAALKEGDNVLAVYVSDTGGGQALLDFGLYGYDLNDIVTHSDVPVSFTNDTDYPWAVNGTEAINGNRGINNTTSWLSMSFYLNKTHELKFDWYKYRYYSSAFDLQLYIDGVLVNSTTNSSWTTPRYYLQPGEHVVAFRDSMNNAYGSHSGVKNVCLREIKPLETAVLTSNSKKIKFTNNSETPWTIEDGYIEHTNYGVANTGSTFSTTFTLTQTSKLSFDRRVSVDNNDTWYNREESHHLYTLINGVQYQKDINLTDFNHFVVTLEPGIYTVEWRDTVFNWYADRHYYSQIKNIELSNNWVNVELATAGTLGYEVLYSPGVNVLTDVEFLKVTGPMNASDWTDIKNMTNLLALDLSDAQITELPNQVFDGKSLLSSVILPEGLKTIGEYAFRGTTIRKMHVPSTVTTIGRNAFAGTPLVYLTFADNSQINTIGYFAFYNCTKLQSVDFGNKSQLEVIGNYAFHLCSELKSVNFRNMNNLKNIRYAAFNGCKQLPEFIMPNSVTELGFYMFDNNTSMKKVHFSDGLTYVPDMACRNCTALTEVHLPVNAEIINRNAFESTTALRHIDIPETVNMIQFHAFYNCGLDSIKLPIKLTYLGHQCFYSSQNLKYAEMPSFISNDGYNYHDSYGCDGDCYGTYGTSSGWDNTFQNCPAMEKIVMRAATPPQVRNDIMNGGRAKSAITLVVPSFAVVSYKLDTYWYQFGTIIEGDDVDYWKVTSPLMMTNNRRMQGKPDVDLYYGGELTVGGNAPFPMGQFNMYVNESNPGRLLNTCEAMTADAATTRFAVDANRWYFFTPIHDVAVADITVTNDASYVFRYYDAQNRAINGASGSWKNVDTNKLTAGQGYIFHCNKACEIVFPVAAANQSQLFNTKDVTRTLVVNESETSAHRSWNYIGNPYPAYYDIYYMDFTAPITVWTGSTYKAYSIADDEFVLRPMQSFFVQKPDAVDEIIFHKEGRQLTTSISHGASNVRARMAKRTDRHIFNLAIFNGDETTAADETRVVINEEASLSYELGCDAAKFMSFDTTVSQLLTLDSGGNCYAINERPMADGQVSLAYYAGQEGLFTIKAIRADGEVFLYDALLDKTIDLTSEDYAFESEATNGVNNSRFTLTFKVNGGGATNIKDIEDERLNNDNSVYDLQGRKTSASQKGIYIKNGRKVVNK